MPQEDNSKQIIKSLCVDLSCKFIAIMTRLKIIFFLLLIFLFGTQSKAQNFNAQLVCGMNVAQVDGDSYGGYNQPGILGGFAIYRNANDKFNYGFELLYSQKGSHKKRTEDDPSIFKLRYTYLCLPLFVDLKKLGVSLKKVTIRLGISNNLNIISKADYGVGWGSNNIRPFELSGIVGVNYKFNKQLGIMIRHENSLLSIGTPAPNQFYKVNRNGLYNRLVSFVISYDLE